MVEQAGGRAITGTGALLALVPRLHQRCPPMFGSLGEVARITAHHASGAS